LHYVRSVIDIDGKDFDKRDKFKFQMVSDDTQIICIDDYEGDIKEMFTKVTGHFEVERKNMHKTVIPFEHSPKILISSNSAPTGFSDSYSRRLHMLQFTDHYNSNYTPADDFGDKDMMSDDWTQDDWDALYSFIFDCVKLYLQKGMVKSETSGLKMKQLIKNTGRSFTEFWCNLEEIDIVNPQHAKTIFAQYKANSNDDTNEQGFYAKCRKMCSIMGWQYESKGNGEKRFIRFIDFDIKKLN